MSDDRDNNATLRV